MGRYRKSTYGQSGARTGAGNTPRPYNSPIPEKAPMPTYKPPVVDDTAYIPSIPGTQALSYQPVDLEKRTKRIRIVDEVARQMAGEYKVAGYNDDEVMDVLSEFDYLDSGEFEAKFSSDAAAVQQMYEDIFTSFTSEAEAELWCSYNAYKGADGQWKLKSTANVPLKYRDAFRRYYLRGILLDEYEFRTSEKTQKYLDSFTDYNSEEPGYVNSIRDVLWNVGNGRGSFWDNVKEWGSNTYGKALESGNAAALGLNLAMAAIEDVDTLTRLFKATGKSILPIFSTPAAEYFNFRNPDSKDYFESSLGTEVQDALLANPEIQNYLEYRFEGDVRPGTDDMKYKLWLQGLEQENPEAYNYLMQYEAEAKEHLESRTEEDRLKEALYSNEAIDFTTGSWTKDLVLEMAHDPTFLIGATAGVIKSTIKGGAKKAAKNMILEGADVADEVAAKIMKNKDLEKQLNKMFRDALPGSEFQKALRQELKLKPTVTNLFSMSDDSMKKAATNFADSLDETTVIDIMKLDEVSEEAVKAAREALSNKAYAALQSFKTERSFKVYKATRQAQYISDAIDMAMLAPVAAVPYAIYKLHKLEKSHRLAQKVAKEDLDKKYGKYHKQNGRVVQMSYSVHEYDNVVTYMKNQEFGLYDTLSPELWDAINEGFGNDLRNYRNSVQDILNNNEVDLVNAATEDGVPTTLHLETVALEEKLEALNKLTEFHTGGKYVKYSEYDKHIQELLEEHLSRDASRAYTIDRGLSNTLTPIYQSIKHMVEKVQAKNVAVDNAKDIASDAQRVSNLLISSSESYRRLQIKKETIQRQIDAVKAARDKREKAKTGVPVLDKVSLEWEKITKRRTVVQRSLNLVDDAAEESAMKIKAARKSVRDKMAQEVHFAAAFAENYDPIKGDAIDAELEKIPEFKEAFDRLEDVALVDAILDPLNTRYDWAREYLNMSDDAFAKADIKKVEERVELMRLRQIKALKSSTFIEYQNFRKLYERLALEGRVLPIKDNKGQVGYRYYASVWNARIRAQKQLRKEYLRGQELLRHRKRLTDELHALDREAKRLQVQKKYTHNAMKAHFARELQNIYDDTPEGRELFEVIAQVDGQDVFRLDPAIRNKYLKRTIKQMRAYYEYDQLLKEAAKLNTQSDEAIAKWTERLAAIDDQMVLPQENQKELLEIAKTTKSKELRETIVDWSENGWKLSEQDVKNPRHVHEKYLAELLRVEQAKLGIEPGTKLGMELFTSLVARTASAAKRYELRKVESAIARIPMSNHIDIAGLVKLIQDSDMDYAIRSLENDIDDLRYAQERLTEEISQASLEYAHNAHREISSHLQSMKRQLQEPDELRPTVVEGVEDVLHKIDELVDQLDRGVNEFTRLESQIDIKPNSRLIRLKMHNTAVLFDLLSNPQMHKFVQDVLNGDAPEFAELRRLAIGKRHFLEKEGITDDVYQFVTHLTYEQYETIMKAFDSQEGPLIEIGKKLNALWKSFEDISKLTEVPHENVRHYGDVYGPTKAGGFAESNMNEWKYAAAKVKKQFKELEANLNSIEKQYGDILIKNPEYTSIRAEIKALQKTYGDLVADAAKKRDYSKLTTENIMLNNLPLLEARVQELMNTLGKAGFSAEDTLDQVMDGRMGWSTLFNTNDVNVVKATIKIIWEDIHKTEMGVGAYEIYEICERINTFGLTVDRINGTNLSDLAKTSIIDKLLSYYQAYSAKMRDPNGEGMANFINEVKQSMYSQAADKRSSLGSFAVWLLDYEGSKEFWNKLPAASEGSTPAKSSKAMANDRGKALYDQYAPKIEELRERAHKDPSADLMLQELFIRIRTPEVALLYDKEYRSTKRARKLSDFETNGTNFDGPSQILQYAWREWKGMKRGVYEDSKSLLDTFFDTKYEAKIRQNRVKVNYHDRLLEADADILALNYGHEPDVLKRETMFANEFMNPTVPQFTEEDLLRQYMKEVVGLGEPGDWMRGIVYHNNNNFDAVALIKRLHNVRVVGKRMRYDKEAKGLSLKEVEIPLYEELYGIMEDGHGWPFKKLYDAVFKDGLENSLELSKPLEAQLNPEQEEVVKAIVADLAAKLPGRMTAFTPVRLRRAIKDYQRILNTDLANTAGKVVYETTTPITSDDLFVTKPGEDWLDPIKENNLQDVQVGDQMTQILNLMESMREINDVFRGEYIEDPFYQIASDGEVLDKFRALHVASPERVAMFEQALKDADQDAVDYYTHFVLKDSLETTIKQAHPTFTPAQVSRLAEEQMGPFNNLYRPLTGNNIAAQYTFQTIFDSKTLQKYFDFSGLQKMTARQMFAAKQWYRKFEYYKNRYKGDITLMHPYRVEISQAIDLLKPMVEAIVLKKNMLDEPSVLYAYMKKPPTTDTITSTIVAQTLMQIAGQPAIELLSQHISPEAVKILTETGMASKYNPWEKPLELLMESDFAFARFLNEMRKPFNSLKYIAGYFNRDGNYFADHIRFGAALAKMEAVLTLLKNAGPETRAKFMKIDQEVMAVKSEAQTNQILQKIVGSDDWKESLMQHLVWNAGIMILPQRYNNVYYKGLITMIKKNPEIVKFTLIEDWNGYNIIALKRGTVFHATRDVSDNPKHFYSSITAGTESEIKAGLAKDYTPPEYDAIVPRDANKIRITQKYAQISPKITVYMDDMEKRLDILTNGKSRGSIHEALTKKNMAALYDQFDMPILDQIIDLNVILEDTYFGNTRFNMSFLGPYKTRFRSFKGAPQVSFVNDYYALRRAVGYAETKIKYVGFWFDLSQGLAISDLIPIAKIPVLDQKGQQRYDNTEWDPITQTGLKPMEHHTDEQFQPILDYLNANKDYSLVSIIPSNVNGSGFELVKQEPVNLADVRRIYEADEDPQWKNIRTIMVPTTVYEQAFSAINRDTFSGPVMQAIAWLTHATKVGQLMAMGATVRNLADGALRVLLSEPEESFAGSFSSNLLNSAKELMEYNRTVRELSKEYAGKGMNIYHLPMMLEGLPKRSGRMTTEQFLMMVGMQGAMGTESDLLKALVQPHNDMNSLRRALVDEQGRNIIGPTRDITTLPYDQIKALYDNNAKEIADLKLDLTREDFLNIVDDKKFMHEEMPISQRKKYSSAVSIMADMDEFMHLNPDDYVDRKYIIEKQYEMIREVLTLRHIKANVTPFEKFKNAYSKGASIALSPMSSVEHILRATQYKIMEQAGYTPTQVLSSITKSQFNYNLKTNAMQRAELMVPFAFFEKNNIEYWARQMVENPAVMRELIQAQGEAAWDFDNYDVEDIAFNYSLQSRMLSGGIPLNSHGLVFKLNPSMFSAMQWMYNPARALLDKTQIPIRQVFLDNMQEYGGLVNALFDESLTWSANPENAIRNGIDGFLKSIFTPNGIPIVGPALMRLTQMLPTYMQRYYQQGGFDNELVGAAASLPILMVTMFGVQLQKPGYSEFASYTEYSDYLSKQGYAYDNNLNKIVPIDKLSPGGLNDFAGFLPKTQENKEENRRRFEELKRLQYAEGKVWDANINKFVYLHELSLGGLNKTYQDDEGNWLPGGWDQLVADKWTYQHVMWDANQRDFVDPSERLTGGLNLPNLTWEEYCYYTEKYFGEYWDGNVGKFVTADLYSGNWGLNKNNLTWDEVQQFKAVLFNEEWDSNLHQWVPLGTSTGNQTNWKNSRTGYFGGYFSTKQIIAGMMPTAGSKVYKAGTKKPTASIRPTSGYGRPQLSPILGARDAVIGLTSRDMHNMIKMDYQGYADYARGSTPRQRLQNMRSTWSLYR